MLKPHKNPSGYKNLLAYEKAGELQEECRKLTHFFPREKTLIDLADQMDRSARSTKQNIVEGWKRNTTKEYFDFLGFSIGACAELQEDCEDIWKGRYPEVLGLEKVMGYAAVTERDESPYDLDDLKFYPLDPSLPPVVQLQLRCREELYLLSQLQKSLEEKMEKEKTLPAAAKARQVLGDMKRGDEKHEKMLADFGLMRLYNMGNMEVDPSLGVTEVNP